MNFATLQGLTIPEGVVTQVTDASGRVLWSSGPSAIESWDVSAARNGSVMAYLYVYPDDDDYYTLSIKGTGPMKDWSQNDTAEFRDKAYITMIKSFEIAEGVTSIGTYAFEDASQLNIITIPNSVVSIGDYAFSHSGVNGVNLGNGVQSIGDYAFRECYGFHKPLIIPNSVTSIGGWSFEDCYFTEITFEHTSSDILSIGTKAFNNWEWGDWRPEKTTINVPDINNINSAITIYNWSGSYRTVTYAQIV